MEWKKSIEYLQKSKGSKSFQVKTAFKIKCSEVHTVMTAGKEVTKVYNVTAGKKPGEAFPGTGEQSCPWTVAHVLSCDTACTWLRRIIYSSTVLLLSTCLCHFPN